MGIDMILATSQVMIGQTNKQTEITTLYIHIYFGSLLQEYRGRKFQSGIEFLDWNIRMV